MKKQIFVVTTTGKEKNFRGMIFTEKTTAEFNTREGAQIYAQMMGQPGAYIQEREINASTQIKPNAPISVCDVRLESVLCSDTDRARFYPSWEAENWAAYEPKAEHLTPAEVLADYNKNQRAEDERKAAAKVAAAPAEVVADMYGDKTRAEVLAVLLNCDTDHAAALLADIENTTDPANVPDWTRYAYEIDEMKRRRCTFGQAVAKVAETRARILSRKTDKEREKWAKVAAAEVAPTNSKTDTRENGKAAAKVAAAALFLLSFTIGNSSPARIYTNTPADILAEVEAAGESVTAYTITQVTPNL